MSPYFIYVLIALIVLSSLVWRGIPFVAGVVRFCKVMFGKIHLDKKSTLSAEQYKKVALGAIFSEQQGAYINSLRTGIDKSSLMRLLSSWWTINDREEAVDTLTYLQTKGFRNYFPAIVAAFKAPEAEQQQIIFASFENDEDKLKAYSQLQNLKATLDELIQGGIIARSSDIEKYGSNAWDCGRLVFVSRACLDVGYITEEEAWRLIDSAAEFAQHSFSGWNDYSKSYVIGRALWGGVQASNSGIIDIVAYLLTEENSPWVQMPW